MRRITSATDSSMAIAWLGSATRPMVANTAESARSSGTPAATTEPKTSRRMIRVSGIEISPALASCELNSLSSALPVDALPASAMYSSGCSAWSLSTAEVIVSM